MLRVFVLFVGVAVATFGDDESVLQRTGLLLASDDKLGHAGDQRIGLLVASDDKLGHAGDPCSGAVNCVEDKNTLIPRDEDPGCPSWSCPNGFAPTANAETNDCAPSSGWTKCVECRYGFHLSGDICVKNECHCQHGKVGSGTCQEHGGELCDSEGCDSGYHSTNSLTGVKCVENICQCKNGQGARNGSCENHGNWWCSSCDNGFIKIAPFDGTCATPCDTENGCEECVTARVPGRLNAWGEMDPYMHRYCKRCKDGLGPTGFYEESGVEGLPCRSCPPYMPNCGSKTSCTGKHQWTTRWNYNEGPYSSNIDPHNAMARTYVTFEGKIYNPWCSTTAYCSCDEFPGYWLKTTGRRCADPECATTLTRDWCCDGGGCSQTYEFKSSNRGFGDDGCSNRGVWLDCPNGYAMPQNANSTGSNCAGCCDECLLNLGDACKYPHRDNRFENRNRGFHKDKHVSQADCCKPGLVCHVYQDVLKEYWRFGYYLLPGTCINPNLPVPTTTTTTVRTTTTTTRSVAKTDKYRILRGPAGCDGPGLLPITTTEECFKAAVALGLRMHVAYHLSWGVGDTGRGCGEEDITICEVQSKKEYKLVAGSKTCTQLGFLPITTTGECLEAAEALGLPKRVAPKLRWGLKAKRGCGNKDFIWICEYPSNYQSYQRKGKAL